MIEITYRPVIKLSSIIKATGVRDDNDFAFDFSCNDDDICRFPLNDEFVSQLEARKNKLINSDRIWDKETVREINNTLAAIEILREVDKEEVLIDVDCHTWEAMV